MKLSRSDAGLTSAAYLAAVVSTGLLAVICAVLCAAPATLASSGAVSQSNGTDETERPAADLLRRHWPPRPWPEGMVWIDPGEFTMGGVGKQTRSDEFPLHKVKLDGFWMDETEVTNSQFQKFVDATGYVTTAEKKPLWDELKKQLPPGTPEPPSSKLVPGAMVFSPPSGPVPLNNYARWWKWVPGACWKHPSGPDSSIAGQERYPVVQVSYDDAQAYCLWAGKRLPTEAQFEYAARGGLEGKIYSWGDEHPQRHCGGEKSPINYWQGAFPYEKKALDGYLLSCPVKSFPANGYGLYEIIGNVWEWCADWYRYDYYGKVSRDADGHEVIAENPLGPAASESLDPDEPYAAKRVVRGGSFLCNDQYCASFRPSARMKETPDTGMIHIGFRTVMSDADWRKCLIKKTE